MTGWPTASDYSAAVQNASTAFLDRDLANAKAQSSSLGLPRAATGAFAVVYRFSRGSDEWAVRCFLQEVTDQANRYREVHRNISGRHLKWFVPFEYIENGIRVQGEWYPILKMQWVEGTPLNDYVATNLDDPASLQAVGDSLVQMTRDLAQNDIAHGDLQHGNILVRGKELVLVDYDGVFVPALSGRKSSELGHPNYQHPGRTSATFDQTVDRFGAWVIWASLQIVARRADFWTLAEASDEQMLFGRRDFEGPSQSLALEELRLGGDVEVARLAEWMAKLFALPIDRIPPLEPIPLAPVAPYVPPSIGSSVSTPEYGPPPEPLPPDSSWLQGHLPTTGVAAPRVTWVSWQRRSGLLGLVAGVLVALMLATVSWVLMGAALALLFVIVPTAAFAGYRSSSNVRLLRTALRELSDARRSFRSLEARAAVAARTRSELLDQLRTTRASIHARQLELDLQLSRDLDAPRQRLATAQLSLRRAAQDLERRETVARAAALQSVRERQLAVALEKHTVRAARLSGISGTLRIVLSQRGVVTAADILGIHAAPSRSRYGTSPRLYVQIRGHAQPEYIEGIGPVKGAELWNWVSQLRKQIEPTLPTALAASEDDNVRIRFRADRAQNAAGRAKAHSESLRESDGARSQDGAMRDQLSVESARSEDAVRGGVEAVDLLMREIYQHYPYARRVVAQCQGNSQNYRQVTFKSYLRHLFSP